MSDTWSLEYNMKKVWWLPVADMYHINSHILSLICAQQRLDASPDIVQTAGRSPYRPHSPPHCLLQLVDCQRRAYSTTVVVVVAVVMVLLVVVEVVIVVVVVVVEVVIVVVVAVVRSVEWLCNM